MSLYERYLAGKIKSENSQRIRRIRDAETEKKEAEKIESLIKQAGGTKYWTNNYVFKFEIHGRYVCFVNQSSRICVTIYNTGLDENYQEMIGDRWLMPKGMIAELDKEIRYKDFIIDEPAVKAVSILLISVEE